MIAKLVMKGVIVFLAVCPKIIGCLTVILQDVFLCLDSMMNTTAVSVRDVLEDALIVSVQHCATLANMVSIWFMESVLVNV